MALSVDYLLGELSDNTLRLTLSTPAPIGGMSLRFEVTHRFGSDDPFIVKSMASGYYNMSGDPNASGYASGIPVGLSGVLTSGQTASGIRMLNSGTGEMSVRLYDSDFSGHGYGNYAARWRRTDSGYLRVISEGYVIRTP